MLLILFIAFYQDWSNNKQKKVAMKNSFKMLKVKNIDDNNKVIRTSKKHGNDSELRKSDIDIEDDNSYKKNVEK